MLTDSHRAPKNEDTWCDVLASFNAPNTIQSEEYSTDNGKDGPSHEIWAVNANWNAGNGWNVNANSVTNPNRWNAENQVVSRNCLHSITPLRGYCFFPPSAEHFAGFVEFFRNDNILFIIKYLYLPRYLQEKLQYIKSIGCLGEEYSFSLWTSMTRNEKIFYRFNE